MRVRSVERPTFSATGPTRWNHPNEAVHNRIAYRVMEQVLEYSAERYARGRLLDIGCGSKPWRGLFAAHVDEHIGIDFVPSERPRRRRHHRRRRHPLPDENADTLLLTSVLEHLEEPERGIAEAYRLLKPGGHVILTAPFIWWIHEAPRDFSATRPSLRHLLEEAGFEVVEVQPLAGAWTTFSLELSYALRRSRGLARPSLAA